MTAMERLSQRRLDPRKTSQRCHFLRERRFILSACWTLYVAIFLGLFSGVGIGIGDNGDGVRVTSPAGLNPQTESGLLRGQGYVVTEFVSAASRNPVSVFSRVTSLHYPTANAYVLTLMGVLSPDRSVSLFSLGWLYLIVGLTIIWLAPLNKVLGPTVITMGTLALAPFLRWTISAFADTPAFFGFAAVLIASVSLLSRLDSKEFFSVNVLLWWGLLLVALSKAAYVVAIPIVLLVFFLTVVVFKRAVLRKSKLLPLFALTAVGLSVVAGVSAVQFSSSDRKQASVVNNHHFVMSVVVPNYPTEIVENAIPESIRDLAPEGYWPRTEDWRDVPGWEETMTDTALVTQLRLALFAQPALLWELMSSAVSRSTTPELDYLVPNTWQPDDPPLLSVLPWTLYLSTTWLVHALLAPLSVSWLSIPLLIVTLMGALGLVVFRETTRGKNGPNKSRNFLALMTFSGLLAGALAGAAILGDGFAELEKHLIMTSFLFTVFALSSVVLLGREVVAWLNPIINSRKLARAQT